MITGNRGEWSEIYTLFKLLGDKILQPGDHNLERVKGVFYPILHILRNDAGGKFEYSLSDDFVLISGGEEVLRVPVDHFKSSALYLLEQIRKSDETTFSIPQTEEFMNSINCMSLKASSGTKTDITIVIHDQRTNQQPILGFSIKSQLGNPSTLLNAGRTTNFIYKVENIVLDSADMKLINSIDSKTKIKERIQAIIDKGGRFKFSGTEQRIFSNNLVLIDSLLPKLLADIVFDFYTSKSSTIHQLVENIEERNPLGFDKSNRHRFYSYKIKRFLTDVALGMMPSVVWTGEYDANGGYLIVKEDGDVLCYHIYDRVQFENYLINNTKLETASSTRHGFGVVYQLNGDLFFNLNLQIRFIK